MLNLFLPSTTLSLHARIDALTHESQPLWGKMNVSQMLAHCCVPFEQALGERHDGPPLLMKLMVKLFFKKAMTNEVPYKQNSPTAPAFRITDQRDLERERTRLKAYVTRFQELGREHFDGREQISLGRLTAQEWNNLMYKHLDHHLRQFGV